MEYKLINPSDSYTFVAKDRETAALTVFSISTMYAAETRERDPEMDIPMFIFGGSVEWYKEQFGRTPQEGLRKRKADVCMALSSFVLGGFADREKYEAALDAIDDPSKKKRFIEKWQNTRTSLNDIGAYAHQLAEKL